MSDDRGRSQAQAQLAEIVRLHEWLELANVNGPDCDIEQALEEFENLALSVEHRSDWVSPGETMKPGEYRILLCTWGPAVQVIGELDDGEPSSAQIQYQDWFTPWETLTPLSSEERDALFEFARRVASVY